MRPAFLCVAFLVLPLGLIYPPVALGQVQKLESGTPMPLVGKIEGDKDVSGAALVGEFLVVASNKSSKICVFRKKSDRFILLGEYPLNPEGHAIDLEGVAAEGNTVYAIGSHSRFRKMEPVERMAEIGSHPARDALYRFTLDAEGKPRKIEKKSLRTVIERDAVLAPFSKLPAKENGVDIEGIAVHKGTLFVGLRGPVLRDGWATVLSLTFDQPEKTAKRLMVNLKGRGIRDLARVDDGFLILAGPVGSGPGSFQIYHWDGQDGLTAKKGSRGPKLLRDLDSQKSHKPEGLTVLAEKKKSWEILLLHDGVANGDGVRVRLPRN